MGQDQRIKPPAGFILDSKKPEIPIPPPNFVLNPSGQEVPTPPSGFTLDPMVRTKPKLPWGQIALDTAKGAMGDVGGVLKGVAETGFTAATGIPSYLMGVAGQTGKTFLDLWKGGFRDLPADAPDPSVLFPYLLEKLGEEEKTKEAIAAWGTYQPESQLGRDFSRAAFAPVELFFKGVDQVAKLASDDPTMQAGVRYLGDLALLFVIPKAKALIKESLRTKIPIDVSKLKDFIEESKEVPEKFKQKARSVLTQKPRGAPKPKTDIEVALEAMEQREGTYLPRARPEYKEPPKEAKIPAPEKEVIPKKGTYNLAKISIEDPTGKIEVFEIPHDKVKGIQDYADKKGIEISVGKPFQGRRKEYYSPSAHEKTIRDFISAVDEHTEKTWARWEKGEALEHTIDKIDTEVREAQKTVGPEVGLSVELTQPMKAKKKFVFEDPEIERRFEVARGIPKPSLPTRAKELIASLKNKITRTYEHLPNTGEYIEVKTALKSLEKQPGVTSDTALRALHGITVKLDKHSKDIFRRKVILDDLVREAEMGHDLPFGFTEKIVKSELSRLDSKISESPQIKAALSKDNKVLEAIKKDYTYWAKEVGFDVESRLTKTDYFRHQVLQYARIKAVATTGKKLKIPTGRGFLKERKGSEFDINTDYFEARYEVMAQMLYDTEVFKAIKKIEPASIHKKVKAEAKKRGFDDWHKAIPEGYVAWQPREGHVFYLADTLPAKIARQVLEGGLDELGVLSESLKKSLAVGKKRKEWVIKKEVARTLDDLHPSPPNWAAQLSKKGLRAWKIWTLISPRRWFKYNLRNQTGDMDAVFVGNPSGFKKGPQSMKELSDLFLSDKPMTKDMKNWFNRGGMESTLQAQELGDIKQLRLFRKFYEEKGGIEKIPEKAWKKYWKTARLTTDFREAVLRYANYLDYLEQMKKNPTGKPKNFGASLPDEVMGLKDVKDRAFRLSNELLGAYDEISVFGQALRNHIYPFWSWKELNFRRYVRFFKNAARDNKAAISIGKKLAKTSPLVALKIGRFMLKATAFWTLLQVWNNVFFPDEEAELPKEVKGRAHIIFGRDKNGKVQYFSRIGALSDFLEWFGLDAAPHLVSSWLSGKKSMRDIAKEMAQAPVNQMVQGLSPLIKTPMELATRRALFPDTFNPKTIRDRGLHIARSLGLENEYKAIAGIPSEPYKETLPLSFIYKSDPLQTAYYEIADMKSEYLKRFGKKGEGFWLTPRSNALYNLKLAHRYGDKEAEKKYLKEYLQYHVLEFQETDKTTKEFVQSVITGLKNALITNLHPLAGLNENEKKAFLKSLDEEDREIFVKAMRFYNEALIGTTDIDIKE